MIQFFQKNKIKTPKGKPNSRRRVNNKAREIDMYRTSHPATNRYIVQSRPGAVYQITPGSGSLKRLTPRRHE